MKPHFPPFSAPHDYNSSLEMLKFTAVRDKLCVNITILEDMRTEGLEDFTAGLNTSVDRVTLDPDEATVNIEDIDG